MVLVPKSRPRSGPGPNAAACERKSGLLERFAIALLCGTLAWPATVSAEVSPAQARAALEDSAWAFTYWRAAADRVSRVFSLPAPRMRANFDYEGEDGVRSLSAFAAPGRLTLRLTGSGWRERTPGAEAVLVKNAAHEAAHLYQLSLGDAERAPRWLHEGFAEALAFEALAALSDSFPGHHDLHAARRQRDCLDHADGAVRVRIGRGDEVAVYDCGHAVVAAVAAAGGVTVRDLYADFAEAGFTEAGFLSLADTVKPGMKRSIDAFLSHDWSHTDADWVLGQLRAARL